MAQPALGGAESEPTGVVRSREPVQGLAAQRARVVAEQLAGSGVQLDDATGAVEDRHGDRAAEEHVAVVRPGGSHGLGGDV